MLNMVRCLLSESVAKMLLDGSNSNLMCNLPVSVEYTIAFPPFRVWEENCKQFGTLVPDEGEKSELTSM